MPEITIQGNHVSEITHSLGLGRSSTYLTVAPIYDNFFKDGRVAAPGALPHYVPTEKYDVRFNGLEESFIKVMTREELLAFMRELTGKHKKSLDAEKKFSAKQAKEADFELAKKLRKRAEALEHEAKGARKEAETLESRHG